MPKLSGDGRILLPSLPNMRQVATERYPLGDYLYDRSRDQHDLAMAKLRWAWIKRDMSSELREQVDKIERLFAKFSLTGSVAVR